MGESASAALCGGSGLVGRATCGARGGLDERVLRRHVQQATREPVARAAATMVAGWSGGDGSAVCLDEGVPGFSDRQEDVN